MTRTPNIFSRLTEVRDVTSHWLREYKEDRPQESLGNLTQAEYFALNDPEVSRFPFVVGG